MEDKKITESDRYRPEFHLGKEAVEEFMPGEDKPSKPEPTKPLLLEPEESINRPLAECYPEVADDENETLMADVRRHWLGRISIVITGMFVVFLLLALGLALPMLNNSSLIITGSSAKLLTSILFIGVAVFVALGTYIAYWVYNRSRLLITNENVIEVRQLSLFSHKVSHLNMINVEDVTVIKRGILQSLFNYGMLQIETAGEKANFSFPNTPDPDKYRRMVINAHEKAIERVGQMGPVQRVAITHNSL